MHARQGNPCVSKQTTEPSAGNVVHSNRCELDSFASSLRCRAVSSTGNVVYWLRWVYRTREQECGRSLSSEPGPARPQQNWSIATANTNMVTAAPSKHWLSYRFCRIASQVWVFMHGLHIVGSSSATLLAKTIGQTSPKSLLPRKPEWRSSTQGQRLHTNGVWYKAHHPSKEIKAQLYSKVPFLSLLCWQLQKHVYSPSSITGANRWSPRQPNRHGNCNDIKQPLMARYMV